MKHAFKTACTLALMFMLAPVVMLLAVIGPRGGYWQWEGE
jgi:hypothetical protein